LLYRQIGRIRSKRNIFGNIFLDRKLDGKPMPRKKEPTRFKYTTRRNGTLFVVYPLPGLKYPVWRKCETETQEAVSDIIERIRFEYQRQISESELPDKAGAFFDFWLDLLRTRVSAKTLSGYEDKIRLHLKPAFENHRLADLKAIHFQTLYKKLLDSGLSAQTVRHVHSVAKNCMTEAVNLELIQKSPLTQVKPPKILENPQVKTMSPAEARAVLESCRKLKHGIIFEFALETGMRPEEYLALSWDAVNLEKRTVEVRRAVVEDENRRVIFAPVKTKHSRRTIKISAKLAKRLREHRENQTAYIKEVEERLRRRVKPSRETRKITNRQILENFAENNLVFPSVRGTPVRSFNLNRRYFVAILRDAGIKGKFTPYNLRHTCCSLMALSGVYVKTASRKLGHANIQTTLNIYTHVLPEQDEAATDALAHLLYD
jgi:integrase